MWLSRMLLLEMTFPFEENRKMPAVLLLISLEAMWLKFELSRKMPSRQLLMVLFSRTFLSEKT